MKRAPVPRSVRITLPCAPFTHQWRATRITGRCICLSCQAQSWCPTCRHESPHLLSVGTWMVCCPPCVRVQQAQQITRALQEVFA